MHYQQLWLGAVLARTQPCDGAGPAVELPGFRHVIDAQEEGQAACGALSGRPGYAPASSRRSSCCGLGRCREDRRIWLVGAPGGAERVDSPARPDIALGWRGASWAKLSLLTSATTSCFDPKEGQTWKLLPAST